MFLLTLLVFLVLQDSTSVVYVGDPALFHDLLVMAAPMITAFVVWLFNWARKSYAFDLSDKAFVSIVVPLLSALVAWVLSVVGAAQPFWVLLLVNFGATLIHQVNKKLKEGQKK